MAGVRVAWMAGGARLAVHGGVGAVSDSRDEPGGHLRRDADLPCPILPRT